MKYLIHKYETKSENTDDNVGENGSYLLGLIRKGWSRPREFIAVKMTVKNIKAKITHFWQDDGITILVVTRMPRW